MTKKQASAKILYNKNVCGKYFKISFKSPWAVKDIRPGQFIEVKVAEGLEPLLRKPLGIHRIEDGAAIEVLYQAIGAGTQLLSKRKEGEMLNVIGPLGNGFDISQFGVRSPQPAILVAGGIGVAPLVFLAQKLSGARHAASLLVLLGGKSKCDILCEKEFKKAGCEVRIATDDGSMGRNGFVTDLLQDLLAHSSQLTAHSPKPKLNTQYSILNTIYACGPKAMLKETAALSARHGAQCQVLLEEYMACGVGVCLGCAVKVRTAARSSQFEYKMVCKDGPVFNAADIIWE